MTMESYEMDCLRAEESMRRYEEDVDTLMAATPLTWLQQLYVDVMLVDLPHEPFWANRTDKYMDREYIPHRQLKAYKEFWEESRL